MDPCITDLYGPVKPPCGAGRKRIDHHHHVRLCHFHHPLNDLLGFHTGFRHNARHKRTDHMDFLLIVSRPAVLLYHMPCNGQVIHHIRAQRIRSHIPVSKAHHDHWQFLVNSGNDLPKLLSKFVGNLPVIIFIRQSHGRGFQCYINSNRLPHRFWSVFCLDHNPGDPDLTFLMIFLFHIDTS